MGFFGVLAGTCFYATTAAPPPTAGAAPTATGWPAMFARTPAIPMRTCSQIVVILASVPLPAPAAAAVFGTRAMMDPKIVPRSSTTGIFCCFSYLRSGEESVPAETFGRARRFHRSWALPGGAHVYAYKPAAQGSWSGRVRWPRRFIGCLDSQTQIPVDTNRAIVGARVRAPVSRDQ